MADNIWAAPNAGAPWKYSMLLNNLYHKWPKRVTVMFDRRAFEYGNQHWGNLSYVSWKRHQLRAIGGI